MTIRFEIDRNGRDGTLAGLCAWASLAAMVAGCGSVPARNDADGGVVGIGAPTDGASGDVPVATDGGGSGGATGRGGTTGTNDGGADRGAGGIDGGAGSTGAAGTTGAGGAGPTCTGAGICGRGPTGIFCAQSNGATAFTSWSSWSPNFSDSQTWKSLQAYWATIQFPDLNGDGRADICGRGSAGIYCSLSTGAGAFAAPSYWSPSYTDTNGWAAFPYYWGTIQFPDVNGDGKADVCGRAGDGIYCGVSNGIDGFGPVNLWIANFADAGAWNSTQAYWGTIQFADVNGDLKADVCGRGSSGVYCALSNGTTAFGDLNLWQAQYSDAAGFAGSPSFWATLAFPDITGDGKADLCARTTGGLYCALSNGTNGFGPANLWSTDYANAGDWHTNQAYWGTIQYPDLNGDGKADVCGRGIGGLVCGISNGTSGFGTPATWASTFSDAAGFTTDATNWGTIQYPDLNGDGKADVCGRASTGVICGLSNGTSAFATANWLDQFTDTNGWRTDLSYGATLQTANLNVTGCRAVTKRSTFSQPLVRRLAPF
ncbi:MAG TPA: VCBS repeat-containing protein [Polyangia bacterium]|nr:VCBS repeat-containing protein [Polyangia bacterium]